MKSIDSAPLFHFDDLSLDTKNVALTGDEVQHAARSMRLRQGDSIQLTNGRGLLARGAITEMVGRPPTMIIDLDGVDQLPLPIRTVTLASAIPKGDRQSVLLDMATQLGMQRFIPLDCDFSVTRYKKSMRGRWQRVILSACKQCRRTYYPVLSEEMQLNDLVAQQPKETQVVYGDHSVPPEAVSCAEALNGTSEILLVVGPEGGFSQAEKQLLAQHQEAKAIAVGQHILRTETAGIALLAVTCQMILSGATEQL